MRRLLAVMLLSLILAGCSRSPLPSDQPLDQTPIQNDPAAQETVLLDKIEAVDDACREIAEAYAFAFGGSLSFRQGETVAFADVFPYFLCAGVYRLDQEALYSLPELAACRDDRSGVYHLPEGTAEELVERGILTEEDLPEAWREGDVYQIPVPFFTVRRELYPYLDAETNTFSDVPAGLVDGYLTEKFPTTVDHTGIDAYDPDTDTYSFTPLAGDFYYDLTFGSSSLALDGVCMFPVIAAPSGETAAGAAAGCQLSFEILMQDGEYRFQAVETFPLSPWDVYEPSEDLDALAALLARRTGTAAADEELIRAVFDYQQQGGRRLYEWSLLPAFSPESPPDWEELSLYIFMMCEETGEDPSGYSTMTAQAFDDTAARYLEDAAYTHQDSGYFTYADGVYTSTGWGDIAGDLLLPVSLTCHGDSVYTMELVGYRFWEWDFPGESDLSPLMEAILAAGGGRWPVYKQGALLGAYLDETVRESLPVSSRMTVTFRLTGEEGAPFRYIACTRLDAEE